LSCVAKGDRFGGALDGAAREFSDAYDTGLIPMEFVNSMRKKGQLIMGIGHRVKSVRLTYLVTYLSSLSCTLHASTYLLSYTPFLLILYIACLHHVLICITDLS